LGLCNLHDAYSSRKSYSAISRARPRVTRGEGRRTRRARGGSSEFSGFFFVVSVRLFGFFFFPLFFLPFSRFFSVCFFFFFPVSLQWLFSRLFLKMHEYISLYSYICKVCICVCKVCIRVCKVCIRLYKLCICDVFSRFYFFNTYVYKVCIYPIQSLYTSYTKFVYIVYKVCTHRIQSFYTCIFFYTSKIYIFFIVVILVVV
jgi:hypothetical protein